MIADERPRLSGDRHRVPGPALEVALHLARGARQDRTRKRDRCRRDQAQGQLGGHRQSGVLRADDRRRTLGEEIARQIALDSPLAVLEPQPAIAHQGAQRLDDDHRQARVLEDPGSHLDRRLPISEHGIDETGGARRRKRPELDAPRATLGPGRWHRAPRDPRAPPACALRTREPAVPPPGLRSK